MKAPSMFSDQQPVASKKQLLLVPLSARALEGTSDKTLLRGSVKQRTEKWPLDGNTEVA